MPMPYRNQEIINKVGELRKQQFSYSYIARLLKKDHKSVRTWAKYAIDPTLTEHKPYKPISQKKSQANYRKNNPLKILARKKVFASLRNKSLEKGKCELCDSHEVEAHHPDHNKPLQIQWLCRKHHLEREWEGSVSYPQLILARLNRIKYNRYISQSDHSEALPL
jgi:hypothetical protein